MLLPCSIVQSIQKTTITTLDSDAILKIPLDQAAQQRDKKNVGLSTYTVDQFSESISARQLAQWQRSGPRTS